MTESASGDLEWEIVEQRFELSSDFKSLATSASFFVAQWVRIWHCCSCGAGCNCGVSLIPGPETPTCHGGGGQKKEKKKKKATLCLPAL